jgi:pantoate--beta-alanine ligase
MKTLRTIAEVRAHVAAARRAGRSVGLVPTMGAFHAGHEALIRAARDACDDVVVSLFVNPSQFEEPADLAAYPRGEPRDAAIAAELGADALFAPPVAEIYPDGFATAVHVAGLSGVLEGAQRGAALRRRLHGRLQAVRHRRAGCRFLRPEGRAAGGRHPAHAARPRHPGPAARRADRARG